MLFLFRKNLFLNSLLLSIYVVVVRMAGLFRESTPVESLGENTLLFDGLFENKTNSFLLFSIEVSIIYFHVLWINRMAIKNNYDRHLSLFPGVFYVLFISILPEHLGLSPMIIANTFILIALSEANKIYKNIRASKPIFNIGFFLGIAIFCYLPYFFMLPVLIISLFSLRAQKIKEMWQLLSGFAVSFFLLFTFFQFYGKQNLFIEYFQPFLVWPFGPGLESWIIMIFIILWILFLVFSNRTLLLKKSVQAGKKINFIYWWLFLSFLVIFIGTNELSILKLITVLTPMGILTGLTFVTYKSKWIPELMHMILLLILFVLHYDLLQYLVK